MTRNPLPIHSKTPEPILPRKRDASTQELTVPRKRDVSIDPKVLLSKIRDKLDYEKRRGITAENPWRRARYHLEQLDRKDPSYVRNGRVRRKKAKEVFELWLQEQPKECVVKRREEGGGQVGVIEKDDVWSDCGVDEVWNGELDGGFAWE